MPTEMTELQFEAYEGGPKVSSILECPQDAKALLLFGHGSHSPMRHPLMNNIAEALANDRVATFRFNYPYSESYHPSDWEASPDPLPVLLATAESALKQAGEFARDLPFFVGGRSMSSQIVTLLAAQGKTQNAMGFVPFVFPMKWRELLKEPTAHLRHIKNPMLFVQGGADDLTVITELQQVLSRLSAPTTLHVVEGADHQYNVPVDSNRTDKDAVIEVASVVSDWIDAVIKDGNRAGY